MYIQCTCTCMHVAVSQRGLIHRRSDSSVIVDHLTRDSEDPGSKLCLIRFVCNDSFPVTHIKRTYTVGRLLRLMNEIYSH